MHDQPVPVTAAPSGDASGPLEGGERVLWRGHAGVAEYAFDQAASLPRWTLPETTEIIVTDRRVIYVYAAQDGEPVVTSGELRWLWPQYLRLQPGARSTDRGAAATQIQLVCGASDGSFPALVFAGGDLRTVDDADKVANVLRQAIARFRVDNAKPLGLSTGQARMLARLLIGPEFMNHQGGDGQTVSLLGAMLVQRPDRVAATAVATPTPEREPNPEPETVSREAPRRPGVEADASRAWAAARAEHVTQQDQPAVAERAADLAARVASMVAAQAVPSPEQETTAELDASRFEVPTTNLTPRAEALRRSAARFTANSAGSRVAARWAGREPGVSTGGNRA
jgi:hypothetical protein